MTPGGTAARNGHREYDATRRPPVVPLQDQPPHARLLAVGRWAAEKARSGAGRRSLVRRVLFGANRISRFAPYLAVEADGLRYLVSARDRAIGVDTFSDRQTYDIHLMRLVDRLLGEFTGHGLAGRQFVDVGANIGTAALPALRMFDASTAICVEPDPENLMLLRCNITLNDLGERARVVGAALSDTVGTAELEQAGWNMGDHRVRRDASAQPDRPTVRIETQRFDDVVDLTEDSIVWLDVQGHEPFVLDGAKTVTSSAVPVVVEYSPADLTTSGGLERMNELIADGWETVVDLRASHAEGRTVSLPARDISLVQRRYCGTAYTDLLLLR